MKKIIRLTETDLVKIVNKVINEQEKNTKGGGGTKKVLEVDGFKIQATQSGNIQITGSDGKVYYYKMTIEGYDTTVINFGNDTITVDVDVPLFGGVKTEPFNSNSTAVQTIKSKLGSDVITTKTKGGKEIILKKITIKK